MTPRPRILPDLLSGDDKTNAVLRRWKAFLDGVLACPLLYGVSLTGKVPDVGDTVTLRHNLGRLPVGWYVTDKQEDGADLLRESWDDETVTFARGATAAVDTPFTLWVY